ncbi:hypothetical protein SAMN04488544_1177 [Microlunatus sagamiharensis]|uniref:Uncharacterized protein n=1 Tax=Microlunatus sagamiharensis TaxID=546874 RepID=A0A1H2M064_9ACTN|nr:hypothetical protein SAMN04488544_1177 [Microlunatus sagamiharensis]
MLVDRIRSPEVISTAYPQRFLSLSKGPEWLGVEVAAGAELFEALRQAQGAWLRPAPG